MNTVRLSALALAVVTFFALLCGRPAAARERAYGVSFVFQDATVERACLHGALPHCALSYDEGPFMGEYQLFDGFSSELRPADANAVYTAKTIPSKPGETLFFSLSSEYAAPGGRAAVCVYGGCAFDGFSLRLLYDDALLTLEKVDFDLDGARFENDCLIYEGKEQKPGRIAALSFAVSEDFSGKTLVDLLPEVSKDGKKLPVAVIAGAVNASSACPGDLNGSGAADEKDAEALLSMLSRGEGADLDGDGVCSVRDLYALLCHFEGFPAPLYDQSFSGEHTVEYSSSVGGEISGNAQQRAAFSMRGSAVSAKPIDGFFRFAGWSDGCPTLRRSEIHICADTKLEARFDACMPDDFVLPKMEINSEYGWIFSKTDYQSAEVTMTGAEDGFNFEKADAEIRGRGNSTWDYYKWIKPSYKLRFEEKAALIPGKGAERDWVLLTTYTDKSMLRNWATLHLAEFFENISFVSGCRFIELTLNGNYLGVYLLCEQVEVSRQRINIDDSVTGPDKDLLMELNARAVSPAVPIQGGQHPYEIKSTVVRSDITSLRKELTETDRLIKSGDREKIAARIDIPSFVDMFILEELSNDRDVGYASFYILRKNGIYSLTAPWDFDLAWGNDNEYPDYDVLMTDINGNDWFKALYKQQWFRELVAARWKELRPFIDAVNAEIGIMGDLLKDGAKRTYAVFDVMGQKIFMETMEQARLMTYREHVEWFMNWYRLRADWLEETFTGK